MLSHEQHPYDAAAYVAIRILQNEQCCCHSTHEYVTIIYIYTYLLTRDMFAIVRVI